MGIAYLAQTMGGLEPRSRNRGRKLSAPAALLALCMTVVSCSSAPETSPDQRPPATSILHFDAALDLVQEEDLAGRIAIYARVARALAESGRLDAAIALLGFADSLLPRLDEEAERQPAEPEADPEADPGADPEAGTFTTAGPAGTRPPERLELDAQLVAVWQLVAARDQTRIEQVETRTVDLLRRAERADSPQLRARVFLTLFQAQLGNPNATELTLRRTLDLAYLIAADSVRAEALVDAGEYLEDTDDRVALNPLVQQAIATVPALEDPLRASELDARLAALSMTLGRSGDVGLLSERVQSRAAAGLLIQAGQEARLRRIVARLGAVDRLDLVPGILANIAPQRVRAEAYGWYAAELLDRQRRADGDAAFVEGFLLAGMVSDEVAASATRARMIRLRAERDPEWDATTRIAELLAAVRLAGFPARDREALITNVTVAYILSDRPELTERLRGLIRTGEEFNRIMISVGLQLAVLGEERAARDYLNRVTSLPPPAIDTVGSPAVAASQAWHQLEEYDRSLVVVLEEAPLVLAGRLAEIPADHVINPATRGRLLQVSGR